MVQRSSSQVSVLREGRKHEITPPYSQFQCELTGDFGVGGEDTQEFK